MPTVLIAAIYLMLIPAKRAFQSQLDNLDYSDTRWRDTIPQQRNHGFNMGALANALPQSPNPSTYNQPQFGSTSPHGMLPNLAMYQMQQQTYAANRNDPAAGVREQHAQYMNNPYDMMSFQPRQQIPQPQMQMQIPMQGQYSPVDPYGFGMGPLSPQAMDPRFAAQSGFGMPNMAEGLPQYMRRGSETAPTQAPVPSFPRGPPRKPKQSGHALWVGNLPPAATVTDLKDHFSRDATKDIESLFLISKSNCAFVNYRSDAACVAAMHRFHDSRFYGVRLVCRLRRSAATGQSQTATPSTDESTAEPLASTAKSDEESTAKAQEPQSALIVSSTQSSPTKGPSPSIPDSTEAPATADSIQPTERVQEKYFIVKSLTAQDLESSVRNGIWATQSHNETTLDKAYHNAENVYLIFSANKSGEYFGYARMISKISGEPVSLSSVPKSSEPSMQGGEPHSVPTPATATAPRGYIIDDSARGTIFWEVEKIVDDEEADGRGTSTESSDDQSWGRQFQIKWMSTVRLPFYRTRGLRNPWNSNREVKIARDGTELETSIGRRLVQMFHQPSPARAPA